MEWIIIAILIIIAHIGLYGVFKKAGVDAAWKAFVPVLGKIEWMKLVGHPTWRVALLFVPLVNVFIYAGLMVSTANSFKRYSLGHHALAVAFAPFYLCFLGFSKDEKYGEPAVPLMKEYKSAWKQALKSKNEREIKKLKKSPFHRDTLTEWTEAIVFAVFAATFIRMFLIEAYQIPTSSMEGSLMTGDFLFVSKAHYGVRMPNTPLQLPLLHNTIPNTNISPYSRAIEWGYNRLGNTSSLKRNDPTVFNFPEGDTIVIHKTNQFINAARGRYDYGHLLYNEIIPREALHNPKFFELKQRPVDRRDFYIKRCVAVAGDKFEIKDKQIYINDKAVENPKNIQFLYRVEAESGHSAKLKEEKLYEMGLNENEILGNRRNTSKVFNLNQEQVDEFKKMGGVKVISIPRTEPSTSIFPRDLKHFQWSIDNFGPLVIPKKGETVKLTPENIALYWRIIDIYENNEYERKGDKFFINGKEASEYTFKMDYYWMMGDNRHGSEDSRYWGFVPEDHISGKPLFIFFSLKNNRLFGKGGIRWNRLFNSAYKFK